MDSSLINMLHGHASPELKKSLRKCKDYNEAWDLLEHFEKDLDKSINEMQSSCNEKLLLGALHEYNDIKDMTQSVIGTLANLQGVTSAHVHEQYNVLKE